jgi:hypothetical protein
VRRRLRLRRRWDRPSARRCVPRPGGAPLRRCRAAQTGDSDASGDQLEQPLPGALVEPLLSRSPLAGEAPPIASPARDEHTGASTWVTMLRPYRCSPCASASGASNCTIWYSASASDRPSGCRGGFGRCCGRRQHQILSVDGFRQPGRRIEHVRTTSWALCSRSTSSQSSRISLLSAACSDRRGVARGGSCGVQAGRAGLIAAVGSDGGIATQARQRRASFGQTIVRRGEAQSRQSVPTRVRPYGNKASRRPRRGVKWSHVAVPRIGPRTNLHPPTASGGNMYSQRAHLTSRLGADR